MEETIYKKEYSISEILSEAWKIFKENFKTILIVVLLVYIPINIVLLFVPEGEFLGSSENYARIVQILEGLIGIIAVMAIAYIVKSRTDGRQIDFQQALGKALSKWTTAIGTNIMMGIFLLGLTLLLIVPGIIYAVYWTFVLYAVVLCDKSGKKALDYSKSIVQGRWWTVLWYCLALSLLSFLAGMLVGFLYIFLLPEHWLSNMAVNTSIDIVAAYFVVVFTVFFLNFDGTKEKVLEAETLK
ncbi:hypothetical protein KAR26_03280 [Candidatus Parcubacteria bacterium]|nr:hypothetical protein [Candidatus Parcubacteria bacterium]